MAEKILQTRIALKIDTLENWENSSLALKKGELAIAVIEPTETNGLAEAVTMIKIGEGGDKTFKDLTWNFHAKAADVVTAAKSNDALTAFVANVIANSGMASDEAMEALVDRMTDAEGAIEVLNGAADVEGSVAKSIADAIAALALADTYVAKEEGKSLIADDEIARLADMSDGANKVEASETNGNIKIDGEEVVVYTHPEKHEIADVTGLQDALDGLQAKGDYAAEEHTHTKDEITDFAHNHEMSDVNGLVDALAGKETAGEAAKVQAALEAYQGTNDAAVKKVADDLAAETEAARAAEKDNADAIAAIKDHDTVDSFADVMAEIAKKQDIIPAETYDAYGSAAQALADANAYADEKIGAAAQEMAAVAEDFVVRFVNDEAKIAALEENSVTREEFVAHQGAASTAIADAMAEAQKKVASVTAADNSVTVAGTSTAPTVAAKLSADADNALVLAEDGLKVVIPAAAEYSVAKDETAAEGYAATYHLTKDGVNVGAAINIPKDMVVESGYVIELAEGDIEGFAAGTYIKLILANAAEDELYIPANSLIEYVTSGSTAGDMVVVNVSDDHKVTATITDGTVTLAKLTTEVQTAIGKAHVHENADVLAGINADKVAQWDAAEVNVQADWNVNDEESDAYIKNRPFYVSEKLYDYVLLEETSYNVEQYNDYDGSYQISSIELEYDAWQLNQKWFEIVVDGTAYDVQYTQVYSDNGYWGVQDFTQSNDYPFYIWTEYGGDTIRMNFKTPGLHTVKITQLIEPAHIKHIDDKFISDNIARVADTDAALASAKTELEGKITAASDNAKSYIDSNVETLEMADAGLNTRIEALEAIDHEHENKDVLDGITAEKVAAWDAAEANVQGDWTQNDESAADYIKNRTHYTGFEYIELWKQRVRPNGFDGNGCDLYCNYINTAFDNELIKEGTPMQLSYSEDQVADTATYTPFISGRVHYFTGIDETDNNLYEYYVFGNLACLNGVTSLGIDFGTHEASGDENAVVLIEKRSLDGVPVHGTRVLIAFDSNRLSTTLPCFKIDIGTETFVPLDERYIPDSIARVEDLAQADVRETDETSPAYIKNLSDIASKENIYVFDGQVYGSDTGYVFTPYERFVEGKTYSVEVDGVVYEETCVRDYYLRIGDSNFERTPFYVYDNGNKLMFCFAEEMAENDYHDVKIYYSAWMVTDPTVARISDIGYLNQDISDLYDTLNSERENVSALQKKVDTGDKKVSEYVTDAVNAVDVRVAAIEAFMGDGEGSVAEQIADAKVEAIEAAKFDALNQDAVVLAEAQKSIDAVQANLDAHAAGLAPVAKTGSTDDLVMGEMVLVFDCGDSTGSATIAPAEGESF